MKPLFIPLLLSCLFFGLTTKAQSLTEKDFRLLIDGKIYSDSTNIISVSELLKLREVTANFSWITVKSIVIYYYPSCDVPIKRCFTNIVCEDAKELMKKLKSGSGVIFSIDEAVNKQGLKVNIKDIVFRIK